MNVNIQYICHCHVACCPNVEAQKTLVKILTLLPIEWLNVTYSYHGTETVTETFQSRIRLMDTSIHCHTLSLYLKTTFQQQIRKVRKANVNKEEKTQSIQQY